MEVSSLAKLVLSATKLVWKGGRLVWEKITQRYLQPIYQRSHAAYLRRHRLGAVWHPLGNLLEVSSETVNIFTKVCGREPRIALRTRNTILQPVKMARLLVRVKGLERRLQETVVAYNIGHEPEKLMLTNVPLEDLFWNGKTLVQTIMEISVALLEVHHSGISPALGWSSEIHLHPTYTDHLNGTFAWKWGQLYNLDQYLRARQELADLIRYALLQPHEYLSWRPRLTLWGHIRRAIFRTLTSKLVLAPAFALLVITNRLEITDDGEISNNMKWISATKFRMWLGLHDLVYRASRVTDA